MERISQLVEKLIANWNEGFPDYPLKAQDLKEPHAVLGALFLIFERLGIDIEAVVAPPQEESCNKHLCYYWDLLPVINTARVVNHLMLVMPHGPASISITHFLQPTTTTSQSILLMLFNLMVFNEDRLKGIAPFEEELFVKTDQVKALSDKKNRLTQMLNEQAEQKGKRSERLEKLDIDKKRLEEEWEQEKELHNKERKEWEALVKETERYGQILQQKKGVKETEMAELAHWKALRVYDVNDVKAQVLQAAKDVQEAEEKVNSTRATLMEKESCLKNLQTIKPALDNACEEMHEIIKLAESLKDYKRSEEGESVDRSVEVSWSERRSAEAALGDARAAWAAAARLRDDARAKRLHERNDRTSALREAEEKDAICQERSKKALQTTEEIKQLTLKYKEEKATGLEELANLKNTFNNELKFVEDALMNKMLEVETRIRNKLKNYNI